MNLPSYLGRSVGNFPPLNWNSSIRLRNCHPATIVTIRGKKWCKGNKVNSKSSINQSKKNGVYMKDYESKETTAQQIKLLSGILWTSTICWCISFWKSMISTAILLHKVTELTGTEHGSSILPRMLNDGNCWKLWTTTQRRLMKTL